MQYVAQQQQQAQPSWAQRRWADIRDLSFISSFFSWLFMLAARLSEPMMIVSATYIILEAGIPSLANPTIHKLAIGIMLAAPEIILPGSFVVAAQAEAQGAQQAGMLKVMCWLFVGLTGITLASLFIFQADKFWLDVINCVRCAAGVGYSIIIRVMAYNGVQTTQHGQHSQHTSQAQQQESLFERLSEIEAGMKERLSEIEARVSSRISQVESQIEKATSAGIDTDDIQQIISAEVSRVRVTLERDLPRLIEARTGTTEPRQFERLRAAQQSAAATTMQTNQDVEQRIRAAVAAEPGASMRRLAELAGTSHTTVSNYLKKMQQESEEQNAHTA